MPRERRFIIAEFCEQSRTDGQAIAPGERLDFALIPETCAHHHRVEPIGFVIIVDPVDRLHSRVIKPRIRLAGLRLVPVQNSSDKWGNKKHTSIGTGHGLTAAKEQRQITLNPCSFERCCCLYAFPGTGDFDEYPVAANP